MAKIEQNIESSKKEEQHKSKSLESNLEELKSEFSNLGNIPIPIITIREKILEKILQMILWKLNCGCACTYT